MDTAASAKPNLFEYDNYRRFLEDFYVFRKNEKPQFSFRFFARLAGFQSPNFLKLVIQGKRNLSLKSIPKFSQALKLTQPEAQFFRNLVLFNQSQVSEEKRLYAMQVLQSRFYRKIHPLRQAQFDYYSNWYFIPVRELVSLSGFQEDPEWIARTIMPTITVAEAKKALEELQKLGLIHRNQRGHLIQTEAVVSTEDEVVSASVAKFHREMLTKAGEAIDRFPRGERELSCATVTLSAESAAQVKELIQNFRRQLLELASSDTRAERVYQVNLQLFPLSEKPTQ